MTDYGYWLAKIAGEDPDPPSNRMELPCGFWRLQRGEPLAVWMDGEQRVALRGFDGHTKLLSVTQMEGMAEQGGFGKAVIEESYRQACALGRWPDTDPVVAAQTAPAGRGHNNPPGDIDILREQIDAAKAGAADYAKIEDDETARRAQSLRSRLLELSREADKKREKEKAPHFEAGKAVDAAWQPLVKTAKAEADKIARALSDHETAKARAAEAARRADAERMRRLERESGISEAEIDRSQAFLGALLGEEPEPPPVVTQIRGGYGRPASVKAVKIAVVVDQDRVYAVLKSEPALIELIAKLAQRAVDDGFTIDGVEIEERRKVS